MYNKINYLPVEIIGGFPAMRGWRENENQMGKSDCANNYNISNCGDELSLQGFK